MPIIKRVDGAQFATHIYRELLALRKGSLLKNEIRLLAQSHGEYVRLFKQDNKTIEAAFSRDPGFLLGETVWQYFGKPEDLIYCEALPEGSQVIIVIVKANTVYLDARIPFASIADEFAPLLTGHNKYDIYIYGNVPITDTAESGKFVFNPDDIKSFNRLHEPVFNKLPLDPLLQLQPLATALRSLQKPVSVKVIAAIILLLVIFTGWWFMQQPAEVAQVAAPIRPKVVQQTYLDYTNALTTPSPSSQLTEMATIVSTLYSMPGWQPTTINYDGNTYQIKLKPMGGDLSTLQQWTVSNRMQMNISSDGPNLSIPSSLPNRPNPRDIINLQTALIATIDRINHLLTAPSIQLGAPTDMGSARAASLTIQYNNISPGVLSLIGIQLAGLPVNLTEVNANVAQGLLSGSIKLNVLGK